MLSTGVAAALPIIIFLPLSVSNSAPQCRSRIQTQYKWDSKSHWTQADKSNRGMRIISQLGRACRLSWPQDLPRCSWILVSEDIWIKFSLIISLFPLVKVLINTASVISQVSPQQLPDVKLTALGTPTRKASPSGRTEVIFSTKAGGGERPNYKKVTGCLHKRSLLSGLLGWKASFKHRSVNEVLGKWHHYANRSPDPQESNPLHTKGTGLGKNRRLFRSVVTWRAVS